MDGVMDLSLTSNETALLIHSNSFRNAYEVALDIHQSLKHPHPDSISRCEECFSGFALLLAGNLQMALNQAEELALKARDSLEDSLKCPYCEFITSFEYVLRRHIQKAHGKTSV